MAVNRVTQLWPYVAPHCHEGYWLWVDVPQQCLRVMSVLQPQCSYAVSTSRYGLSSEEGSHCTPLGLHRIAEKIGADEAAGTVFVGRRPNGENCYALSADALNDSRDFITSRILWLEGLESANANSHQRYIYLHGTAAEAAIGTPASIGCIRLRNADIIALFDQVSTGTPVYIDSGE